MRDGTTTDKVEEDAGGLAVFDDSKDAQASYSELVYCMQYSEKFHIIWEKS